VVVTDYVRSGDASRWWWAPPRWPAVEAVQRRVLDIVLRERRASVIEKQVTGRNR
jgi:hypothetical protein